VKVRLLLRRAFKELMDQKGWDMDDILMEEETVYLAAPTGDYGDGFFADP
jgi:hypothetical protein